MRVLVTGGAGFIGSHVVEACCEAGFDVHVLDDLSTGRRGNVPAGVPLHEVDIRDEDAVQGLVGELAPELISHHAAQTSVTVSVRDPTLDAAINVGGSLNVLSAARSFGVRRLVFASTGGAIYGEVPPGKRASVGWREAPISPYGVGKLSVEQQLPTFRSMGLETVTLRYANVYGPRQRADGEAGVVAIFATRLLRGETVSLFGKRTPGDGGGIRDYVYVWDVVRANLWAMQEAPDGLTIDVCSGVETSTAELLDQLAAAIGMEPVVAHRPPRPGDLERSVLDPGAQERVLGAATDLRTGLSRTLAWFREDDGLTGRARPIGQPNE